MAKPGYVWDGTQFIPLTAPVGAFPNAVAVYSTVAPTSPKTGHVWFDQASGFLKIYNGSSWIPAGIPYSSSEPSTPTVGMLWVDSNGPSLKVYNGSSWVSAGGSATDSDQNIIANQVFR